MIANIQKLISGIIIGIIFYFNAEAQTWQQVGNFTGSDAVYALAKDANGNLYAGGDFRDAAFNRYVAVWDGNDWDSCGIASWNPQGQIRAMAVDGNNVYVSWIIVGGTRQVMRWDGSTWSAVGALNANNTITALCVDSAGNLYAAGKFSGLNGEYVAKWDGASWTDLGDIAPNDGEIFSICADDNGNIYAAGEFTNANNKFFVAKYNGTAWSELGAGGNELNADARIRTIAADAQGNIYAAGDFNNANNKKYVAKWNGAAWSELGTLNAAANIKTLAAGTNGNIYAGGDFYNASLQVIVAKWNGSTWSELGNAAFGQTVLKIITDASDNVYATGGNLSVVTLNDAGTTPTPPAAPTNLTTTVFKTQGVNIRIEWTDNANNELGFKVERSEDGNNFTEIAGLNADTELYEDLQLSESTTYYYKVLAYNNNGNSVYSNTAQATTGTATGIAEKNNMLKIYPNPAQNIIHVTEATQITVLNLNGQEVGTAHSSVMNIESLSNGFYFIKANYTDGLIRFGKFLKK